jgi:hypothetical protein
MSAKENTERSSVYFGEQIDSTCDCGHSAATLVQELRSFRSYGLPVPKRAKATKKTAVQKLLPPFVGKKRTYGQYS